jgi:hypothetical protein
MGDLGGRARRAWRKEQEKRNEKQRSLAASKHKWEAEDAQRLAGLLGECIAAWAGRLDLPPLRDLRFDYIPSHPLPSWDEQQFMSPASSRATFVCDRIRFTALLSDDRSGCKVTILGQENGSGIESLADLGNVLQSVIRKQRRRWNR